MATGSVGAVEELVRELGRRTGEEETERLPVRLVLSASMARAWRQMRSARSSPDGGGACELEEREEAGSGEPGARGRLGMGGGRGRWAVVLVVVEEEEGNDD